MQWLEVGELPPEDLDPLSRTMAFHLRKLIDERDECSEVSKLASLLKLSAVFYLPYIGECGKMQVKDQEQSLLESESSGVWVFCFVCLLAGPGAYSRERLLAVAAIS